MAAHQWQCASFRTTAPAERTIDNVVALLDREVPTQDDVMEVVRLAKKWPLVLVRAGEQICERRALAALKKQDEQKRCKRQHEREVRIVSRGDVVETRKKKMIKMEPQQEEAEGVVVHEEEGGNDAVA